MTAFHSHYGLNDSEEALLPSGKLPQVHAGGVEPMAAGRERAGTSVAAVSLDLPSQFMQQTRARVAGAYNEISRMPV